VVLKFRIDLRQINVRVPLLRVGNYVIPKWVFSVQITLQYRLTPKA
jgi:hypothetical protein